MAMQKKYVYIGSFEYVDTVFNINKDSSIKIEVI